LLWITPVPLLGHGLVTSDGEFWRRQRRIAQPAFHRARIAAFSETMRRVAEALAASWAAAARGDGVVDVAGDLIDATLRIVCETLLGGDPPEEIQVVKQAFPVASHEIVSRMNSPVPAPLWIPTPANRRFLRARRALDDVVYKIIARRRAAGAGEGLLGMLLSARDEETGAGMSDEQLRDEVLTMLLAGHETTATALTFTFHLLGAHPEAAGRLREEAAGVLGAGESPSLEQLERLPYARMVIEEAMRLYPPIWVLSRSVAEDDEIGGFRIERGGMMMVSPWVTHRLPDLWEEPARFLPERFAPERVAAMPRFAYFPFLGGPRQCIGNHFALMEAQILLATLARRLRVSPLQDGLAPLALDPSLTLRPKGGLRMRVAESN
jgi:cytochrome P450